jgi:hypothetical protein
VKCLLTSIMVLLSLLYPFAASALDVSGQSRTYLFSRQTVESERLLPLYEYLDFRADSGDKGAVSFNFGGWYRYDLRSESFNGRSNEDLQYAYLSFKQRTGNAALNLGRVRVYEGVSSDLVDGVYGRTDLKGGFGIAAYGGSPVATNFDDRRGDTIYGGRLYQGMPGIYMIGVSYLDEKNNSTAFRREGGVDLWFRPLSKLELQGMSSYNDLTSAWMQHNYYLTIGAFGPVRLIGEYSKVSYKDYFTGTVFSAFTFTTNPSARTGVNPDETVTTNGGSLEYAFNRSFTVILDYKGFNYTIAGNADYYGGKFSYAGSTFSVGAGAHRMDGAIAALQYDEQNLYVWTKISKVDISLQGIHVAYDEAINGVTDAYNVSATAGYSFTPKARAVADIEYSKNPDFDKDVRGMLSFVYLFDVKGDTQKPKTGSSKKN